MNVRFHFVVLLSVAVTSLGLLTGCSEDTAKPDAEESATGTVDPHDVPITDEQKEQLQGEMSTIPKAVVKIKELRDTVEQETKDGIPDNPFDAHQALDKADIVVQWLPKIAQDSGVAKEHWETVSTAASELRECFDTVHLNIDNKVDPDFASVKDKMDEKIAELEAITP
jgi:hypothetical protein